MCPIEGRHENSYYLDICSGTVLGRVGGTSTILDVNNNLVHELRKICLRVQYPCTQISMTLYVLLEGPVRELPNNLVRCCAEY